MDLSRTIQCNIQELVFFSSESSTNVLVMGPGGGGGGGGTQNTEYSRPN